MTETETEEAPPPVWHQPVLLAVLILCLVPELVLTGADWGLWGSPRWRILAFRYGGFWSGLLHGWRTNYPGQSLTMFATYAFLHGGLVHFTVNMMTLFSLGPTLGDRFGQARLLLIYIASALGGALGFALLAETTQPMVGASGALFGLAGAVIGLAWQNSRAGGAPLYPVLRAIALLAGLNLVMWLVMDGQLAWETHLGGFVTGWIMALWFEARATEPDR